MADFAPNYTPRYCVKYIVLGRIHKMQFRLARGVTDFAPAAGKVESFLATLESQMYDNFAVLSADAALTDSDIFLPAPAPASPSGAISSSGTGTGDVPLAISFPGRSVNGLRGIVYVYGTQLDPSGPANFLQDYRIQAAELGAISDAVSALNELSPAFVGNDGATLIWYPYVNTKPNDHWIKKLRV